MINSASTGDIRDVGSVPGSGRSSGGRHGNPLQYSCLENPMDRGAWQVIVHGITKSRTWLKWLSKQSSPSPSSRSWWWTGKTGVLQSMGLQRVRHDWLNWTQLEMSIYDRDVPSFLRMSGYKVLLFLWIFKAVSWLVPGQNHSSSVRINLKIFLMSWLAFYPKRSLYS